MIRLVHPFPSLLDGMVVGAVALLAGGGVDVAVRLAASMTALQFAIGALNDIVDAPADTGRLPAKPIPGGLVAVPAAWVVAMVAAVAGLGLAATIGGGVVVLAVIVLAIGAAYDLVAKGTSWSWLPFAVGIPILPVFGWYGATGALPGFFWVLIPMAILAGAALAIANARADLDVDRAAGTTSVATRLGAVRSWWLGAGLFGGATAIGIVFVGRTGWTPLTWALVVLGTAVLGVGLIVGRRDGGAERRRGWVAQAVGAAIAALGWVSGMIPVP